MINYLTSMLIIHKRYNIYNLFKVGGYAVADTTSKLSGLKKYAPNCTKQDNISHNHPKLILAHKELEHARVLSHTYANTRYNKIQYCNI